MAQEARSAFLHSMAVRVPTAQTFKGAHMSSTSARQRRLSSALVAVLVLAAFFLQPIPASAVDVGSEQDTAGPQIASFSSTPAAVDVRLAAATITATAQITDDLSGLNVARVFYRSPSGIQSQTFVFGSHNRTSGDALSGMYSSSVSIDTQQESGIWRVSGATTTDAVGNTRSYSEAEARAFGTADFTVTSNRDATKPAVTAVRWSPSPLDVSGGDGMPVFEWDATDEGGSGVYYVNISVSSPSLRQRISGQAVDFSSTVRNAHTFTAVGAMGTPTGSGVSFENGVPQYSEPGTWTVNYVQVMDRANNQTTYQGTALAAILQGPFVVAANPTDTTDPVISAYRFSPASIDVSTAPKSVNVEIDVSDELSGVQAGWVTFKSPIITTASPQFITRTASFFQTLPQPRITAGTLTASVTFPTYDRSGDWSVDQVCVVDRVKHVVCRSGAALGPLGPTGLNVVANEPPAVAVTGVQNGATYQAGSVPAAACDVRDREDGVVSGVQPVVTGPDAGGAYTATCSYTDRGGKTGTATVTYKVEGPVNTPPTVTVTGVTATSYELGAEPVPGCTVTDAEDTGETAVPAVGPADGAHGLGARAVTCSYTDDGGLTATSSVTYTVVDTGLPTLSGAPTTSPNAAGWYRGDVTIHWTAEDTGTGIDPATVPVDETISTEGTGQTRTASVADLAGNTATATSAPAVNIDRTAPSVGTPSFSLNPKATTQSTTLSAAVSDNLSGVVGGEYFLESDPGAGNGTPLTLGADRATLTHVFGTNLAPGVYTVGVRSVDAAGNWSATATELLVVYDPNGGFVTGGGHIASPAGAWAADPSASGRATFGFVSKYQKGAATPTGNTEFQFNAGGLNFSSTSYEWLVISGARAQYKGNGTVNGVAGYKFLLTATDGAVNGGGGADKFRIKITKDGTVVYDNLLGAADDATNAQVLTGGSIVIHAK